MEQYSPERKTGAYIERQPKPVNTNRSRLVGKKAIEASAYRAQTTQRALGQAAIKNTQRKRSR
jgi:hypothetical protein